MPPSSGCAGGAEDTMAEPNVKDGLDAAGEVGAAPNEVEDLKDE